MKDPIKQLFKQGFEEFNPSVDFNEWYSYKELLSKHNFLRFNLFQFNVYYALAIATCFLLSIGTTAHYAYHFAQLPTSNSVVVSGKKVEPTTHSGIDEATTSSHPIHNPSLRTESTKVKRDKNSESEITPVTTEVTPSQDTATKAEPTRQVMAEEKQLEANPALETPKIVTKRQRIIVPKQDTIHRFDTVKSRKVFWRKRE